MTLNLRHISSPTFEIEIIDVGPREPWALSIEFDGGSYAEPVGHLGLAHFLEHMMFHGGAKYKKSDRFMPYVQKNRGKVNASTKPYSTNFHFQIGAKYFFSAAKRLVDMLLNPDFSYSLLQRELKIIHEEYLFYQKAPKVLIDNAFSSALEDNQYSCRFYSGNKNTLNVGAENFLNDLVGFYKKIYLNSSVKVKLAISNCNLIQDKELIDVFRPLIRCRNKLKYKKENFDIKFNNFFHEVEGVGKKLAVYIPVEMPAGTMEKVVWILNNEFGYKGKGGLYASLNGVLKGGIVSSVILENNRCSVILICFETNYLSFEEAEKMLSIFYTWLNEFSLIFKNRIKDYICVSNTLCSGHDSLRRVVNDYEFNIEAINAIVLSLETGRYSINFINHYEVKTVYDKGLKLNVKGNSRYDFCFNLLEFNFTYSPFYIHTQPSYTSGNVSNSVVLAPIPEQVRGTFFWGWKLGDDSSSCLISMNEILLNKQAFLSFYNVNYNLNLYDGYVFLDITAEGSVLPFIVSDIILSLNILLPIYNHKNHKNNTSLREYISQVPYSIRNHDNKKKYVKINLEKVSQVAFLVGNVSGISRVSNLAIEKIIHFKGGIKKIELIKYKYSCKADTGCAVVLLPLNDTDLAEVLGDILSSELLVYLTRELRNNLQICYSLVSEFCFFDGRFYILVGSESSSLKNYELHDIINYKVYLFLESISTEYLMNSVIDYTEDLIDRTLDYNVVVFKYFKFFLEKNIKSGFEQSYIRLLGTRFLDIERELDIIKNKENWMFF